MQNSRHIVVFARAPTIGRVKRRLAADVGHPRARRYYHQNLSRLIEELQYGPWQLHIAAASYHDARHPMFTGRSVLVQPYGDLGYRMQSILQKFDQQKTLLIGSDIHEISSTHMHASFSMLKDHDVVFGPAFDGGFWLVGCHRARALGWRFMRNVRWSTAFALQDTMHSVSSNCRVGLTTRLHDVDNGLTFTDLYIKSTY